MARSGGSSFNYFSETQLTKFSTVSTCVLYGDLWETMWHMKVSAMGRGLSLCLDKRAVPWSTPLIMLPLNKKQLYILRNATRLIAN